MPRVILHGELAEKFNNEYRLDVASPKEAIRALCCLVPNFKNTFADGAYYIYVEENEIINIDESNIDFNSRGDIHIVPEVVGAKKGGLGKVLMGIALIGLAVFTAGAGAGFAVQAFAGIGLSGNAAITATGLAISAMTNAGIALALGGAAQMLAPKVQNNTDAADKQQSYLFNGSDTNIANGSCVPLVYGRVLAAGYPITFDISNEETNNETADTTYNSATGGWKKTIGDQLGIDIP